MEEFKLLLNYGVLGVIVIALSKYILKRDKENSAERKDWQGTMDRNTNAITALTKLLETTRERKR